MNSNSWQSRLQKNDSSLRVHLIGIGGAGLSAIAQVLLERGVRVSGSDRQESSATRALAQAGAEIFIDQRAENLTDRPASQRPDVVLISSAIAAENPERRAAQELGLPVVKRQTFLRPFLAGRRVIAVAGTHGKSTTTAMIVQALHENGCDAGYIVGSTLPGYGNAHAGSDRLFVIEADEYDRMFHGLTPSVAVITNVEWDHPDCYPTPESFAQAFAQFVAQVEAEGRVVSCGDDPGAEALRQRQPAGAPLWRTYGLSLAADVRAVQAEVGPAGGYTAQVLRQGKALGPLQMQAPGLHNLRNALAALTVATDAGVPPAQALASLRRYAGIARRFELKGTARGVTVVDDYAHHPTEVQATLAAARSRFAGRKIWAVFQPHTFSRTGSMLAEMAASFADADAVLVTDIYAARETGDGSLTGATVAAASPHPCIRHSGSVEATSELLAAEVQPGDVVLTLGAGTSYRIGELLLERLQADG